MSSQFKLRAVSPRSGTGTLVLRPQTEQSFYHPWMANTSLNGGGG